VKEGDGASNQPPLLGEAGVGDQSDEHASAHVTQLGLGMQGAECVEMLENDSQRLSVLGTCEARELGMQGAECVEMKVFGKRNENRGTANSLSSPNLTNDENMSPSSSNESMDSSYREVRELGMQGAECVEMKVFGKRNENRVTANSLSFPNLTNDENMSPSSSHESIDSPYRDINISNSPSENPKILLPARLECVCKRNGYVKVSFVPKTKDSIGDCNGHWCEGSSPFPPGT
jgi:hypothetical protein